MGNDKRIENSKVIVVEFNVSMHCNACERTVAKAISKCKGVEKFTTDMNNHRVVVMGRFDPKKVLKKLKKKTGKKVEIVANEEDEESKDGCDDQPGPVSNLQVLVHPFVIESDCCIKTETLMMFSDENPNACVVM